MRRYGVGRLVLMIPTLVGVAILTFVIMRAVPGDIVALKYAGSPVPQSVIDDERHQLGLDKPMWEQFTDWMGELAHFDLGTSLWTGRPVVDEVLARFPLSLELAIIATLLAIAIAIPLGVVAAVRQDSWADYAIRIFSIGGAPGARLCGGPLLGPPPAHPFRGGPPPFFPPPPPPPPP